MERKKQVDLSKHVLLWIHNESQMHKSPEENLSEGIHWREQIRDLKRVVK